jgi:hypothetical protein
MSVTARRTRPSSRRWSGSQSTASAVTTKPALIGMTLLVALGVATAIAFTANNNVSAVGTPRAGYGPVTVSGAKVNSLTFVHSADGTQITEARVVLNGDRTGHTVNVGFGGVADKNCTVVRNAGSPATSTATCTGLAKSITTATSFNISVVK